MNSAHQQRPGLRLRVDGAELRVPPGASLAAALLSGGVTRFRRGIRGEPRAPLCGMGICFECRVTIDGVAHRRACMVEVREGMEVRTDD
jgi:sarcosine oxidase subunit alpha